LIAARQIDPSKKARSSGGTGLADSFTELQERLRLHQTTRRGLDGCRTNLPAFGHISSHILCDRPKLVFRFNQPLKLGSFFFKLSSEHEQGVSIELIQSLRKPPCAQGVRHHEFRLFR
jgi:hypothetical protein